MIKIIEDLQAPDLIAAMDGNMAAYWSAYGRGPGGIQHHSANMLWQYTSMPVPVFNGVHFARIEEADVPSVIQALQAQIDRHSVGALWWISPNSQPKQLGKLLLAHGLKFSGETPAMAVELREVAGGHKTPENFTLLKVEDRKMQAQWGRTAAFGFGFSEREAAAMAALEEAMDDETIQSQPRYLGYLDDQPVATSALVYSSGLAGIYAVTTLSEARGKGIGRWMTVYPLLQARQRGYRIGILQASAMGYPIYRKIGFKELFKYQQYFQMP
ncbi:MAG: hypothetical protein P8046_11615 [Anaerolineales bacterium]